MSQVWNYPGKPEPMDAAFDGYAREPGEPATPNERRPQMVRAIVFHLILSPLIRANYWLRFHRFAADKWFWADVLALKWGYSIKLRMSRARH